MTRCADLLELLELVEETYKNTPFPDLYKEIVFGRHRYVSPDAFIRKHFGKYAFDNRSALQVVANYLRENPTPIKEMGLFYATDKANAAMTKHGETAISLLDRLYTGNLGRVSDEEIVQIRLHIYAMKNRMPVDKEYITVKYYIRSNSGEGEEIMVNHSIRKSHSVIYMPGEEV